LVNAVGTGDAVGDGNPGSDHQVGGALQGVAGRRIRRPKNGGVAARKSEVTSLNPLLLTMPANLNGKGK
jgi:hypothetical protein